MGGLPYSYDLDLRRGQTFTQVLRYSTKDNAGVTAPVNLTGWKARLQIRSSPENPTALATLDSDTTPPGNAYGNLSMNASGYIQFGFSKATTQALKAQKAFYDLRLTRPDGTAFFLLKGAAIISPTVTRNG